MADYLHPEKLQLVHLKQVQTISATTNTTRTLSQYCLDMGIRWYVVFRSKEFADGGLFSCPSSFPVEQLSCTPILMAVAAGWVEVYDVNSQKVLPSLLTKPMAESAAVSTERWRRGQIAGPGSHARRLPQTADILVP